MNVRDGKRRQIKPSAKFTIVGCAMSGTSKLACRLDRLFRRRIRLTQDHVDAPWLTLGDRCDLWMPPLRRRSRVNTVAGDRV